MTDWLVWLLRLAGAGLIVPRRAGVDGLLADLS
jgi:hypothetical protein